MERLDFASVMRVIHDHIREDLRSNQTQLIETLFWDMLCDSDANKSFDEGQVCKWMSGLAKLSPKVSKYYQERSNQRKLAVTIEERILPMMPDSAMAVQELHDLLIQAPNVSQPMKANLTEGFPFEDQNEEAVFITDVLCLAMQVKYEKRDIRSKSLLVTGSLSPAVQGYIYDSDMPKPCRWFVGREKELEQLHGLLVDHSKVFLHGIPGIGKSELAKAYVSRHGKEYTNVLYLYYGGDLKRMIADMDFADDRPDESQEARFQRHDRFLRTLRDDTLLVVDNFNVTASEDSFLDVMLRYRCRILFTTRCRYEDQASLEIQELPPDMLVELMGKFYDADRKPDVMKEIIELLHGHTFAVELAARLLANSMLRPKALLRKLKKEKAAMDAEDRIRSIKDGTSRKATYYDHIHTLFSLCRLSRPEQQIMRCLIFVPEKGVPVQQFGVWMNLRNLNRINDLIEMGFVQPGDGHYVSLHPMIREVALDEMAPSVHNCAVLMDSFQRISLMHGMEFQGYKQLFQTVENIIGWIQKDDMPKYLLFLENTFQYMEKYRYEPGMRKIIAELEHLLSDPAVGTTTDRVLLLDCKASYTPNPLEAIVLEEEALQLLGDVTPANALLTSNLHSNLGALYYGLRNYPKARMHMEQGISILESYPVPGYHDCIMQISNYATLLTDLGEPQRGYDAMLKLAQTVREKNSDYCFDYGLIQQTLGGISLAQGDEPQANTHFQKAMQIYQLVFEDEPLLLEQKRREIGQMALKGRTLNQKLLTQ